MSKFTLTIILLLCLTPYFSYSLETNLKRAEYIEKSNFICPIRVVIFDDNAVEKFGVMPKRSIHANLISTLNEYYKPKLIFYKVFFVDDNKDEGDKLLSETVKKYSNVMVSIGNDDSGDIISGETSNELSRLSYKIVKLAENPKTEKSLVPFPNLLRNISFVGSVNAYLDKAEDIIPLSIQIDNKVFLQAYLSLTLKWFNIPEKDLSFDKNVLAIKTENKEVQMKLNEKGDFILEKPLDLNKPIKVFSFCDVLDKKLNIDELKDTIVIVGIHNSKTKIEVNISGKYIDGNLYHALVLQQFMIEYLLQLNK